MWVPPKLLPDAWPAAVPVRSVPLLRVHVGGVTEGSRSSRSGWRNREKAEKQEQHLQEVEEEEVQKLEKFQRYDRTWLR